MKTTAFVIAIIVSSIVLGLGCGHVQTIISGNLPAADLARLYCVDHPACSIYRSEQPDAAAFSVLASAYRLKSDLKLNLAIEERDHLPDGVDEIHVPWLPAGPVNHDDVARALDALTSSAKPVLIHCSHGVDRTGLLVALYRVKVQHVLASSAWTEWRAFGHGDDLPMLDEAFFRETGWRP